MSHQFETASVLHRKVTALAYSDSVLSGAGPLIVKGLGHNTAVRGLHLCPAIRIGRGIHNNDVDVAVSGMAEDIGKHIGHFRRIKATMLL